MEQARNDLRNQDSKKFHAKKFPLSKAINASVRAAFLADDHWSYHLHSDDEGEEDHEKTRTAAGTEIVRTAAPSLVAGHLPHTVLGHHF